MRILFLGNNQLAWRILKHLKSRKEKIVGLVLHPKWDTNLPQRKKIIADAQVPSKNIFLGHQLKDPAVLKRIKKLKPDIALLMNFGYIVRPEFLKLFPQGAINLHPAYLPYNRGQFPNVWSIVDRVQAGVTLHYVDSGIDTGPIAAQVKVRTESWDTGQTLFVRLQDAAVDLFRKAWPKIKSGRLRGRIQKKRKGSFYKTADVQKIDAIDLNKKYRAGDLINILRARTFPPYDGAYFMDKHRHVYLRLTLHPKRAKPR